MSAAYVVTVLNCYPSQSEAPHYGLGKAATFHEMKKFIAIMEVIYGSFLGRVMHEIHEFN